MTTKRLFPVLLLTLTAFAMAAAAIQPAPIPLPPGESVLSCTNGATVTVMPPNRANCPIGTPTPTRTATPTIPATATPVMPPGGFLATFDGTPGTPQPWRPSDWDVVVHSRDRETWVLLDSMTVQHGPGCEPPPGQHTNNTYDGAVFLCRHHVMTAIRASGYGVIYLTPNQMVDFSAGEAVIRFDMSTLRTSNRDWVDLWVTPYEDNLVAPLEDWLPDLNGEPRRAVHIRMRFGTAGNLSGAFEAFVIDDFEDTAVPLRRTAGYETYFTPSASLRQTFELRLSQTHIKFGMPVHDLWWIDSDIAPLGWTAGVVQIGHHSYNPMKDCSTCRPGTWHWDNVSIAPAVPFTIIRADRRFVDTTSPAALTFIWPTPTVPPEAPPTAHLRFSGIGNAIEVSFDGGVTWRTAVVQAQEETSSDHFRSYFTTIPTGTNSVLIRGQNWWGGRWHVRDISIWARVQP